MIICYPGRVPAPDHSNPDVQPASPAETSSSSLPAKDTFQVIVPAGVVAGQLMHVKVPHGGGEITVQCTVPAGVERGSAFHLELDPQLQLELHSKSRATAVDPTRDSASPHNSVHLGTVRSNHTIALDSSYTM